MAESRAALSGGTQHLWDCFLGGPWQSQAAAPYKDIIRRAFPDKKFYDPEEHNLGSEDWFVTNVRALQASRNLLVWVPQFPFAGVAILSGIFYHNNYDPQTCFPLANIIFIWPPEIEPDYDRESAEKIGIVVHTMEAAISRLRQVI